MNTSQIVNNSIFRKIEDQQEVLNDIDPENVDILASTNVVNDQHAKQEKHSSEDARTTSFEDLIAAKALVYHPSNSAHPATSLSSLEYIENEHASVDVDMSVFPEWVSKPENENLANFALALLKELSLSEISTVLKKLSFDDFVRSIDNFQEHHLFLKRISNLAMRHISHYRTNESRCYNRYQDAEPFVWNRTCKGINNFYINASDVVLSDQRYILAQGPLDTTVLHFFRMRQHTGAKLIISLTRAREFIQGEFREKCYPYWEIPSLYDPETQHFQIIEKTQDISPADCNPNSIILRTYKDHSDSSEETFYHIHMQNWDDYSVVKPSNMLYVFDKIKELIKLSSSPIITHCSAGIGRSGTFAAAHNMSIVLEKIFESGSSTKEMYNPLIDVLLLRLQRDNAILKDVQLKQFYDVIVAKYLLLLRGAH